MPSDAPAARIPIRPMLAEMTDEVGRQGVYNPRGVQTRRPPARCGNPPERRPLHWRLAMNRRDFLAASTAAAALASATVAPASAGPSGRLKVIVPVMDPSALADLEAAAPGVALV